MRKNEIYTAIALITIIFISVICKERLNNSRRIVETFPEMTGKLWEEFFSHAGTFVRIWDLKV